MVRTMVPHASVKRQALPERAVVTLQALKRIHEHKTLINTQDPSLTDLNLRPLGNLYDRQSATQATVSQQDQNVPKGAEVAHLFAAQAAKFLTSREHDQLQRFLREQTDLQNTDNSLLKEILDARLQTFYDAEVKLSGESQERLATPGGPLNADLGVILHVQTLDGFIDAFWDPRSTTMTCLVEKGITGETTFGYDWHWRAQPDFNPQNNPCPASKWSKPLKDLHNQLSIDVLDILPLPFVITLSKCTRENFRRSFSKTLKPLDIELPNGILLKCDLDFRGDCLRRIILHVPHPVAATKGKRENRASVGLQTDAGINFFTWLSGEEVSDHDYFFKLAKKVFVGRSRKQAPLGELYHYRSLELTKRRPLEITEFTPSCLNWITKYIGQEPAPLIASGSSIIQLALDKLATNVSRGQAKARQKKSHQSKEIEHELDSVDDRNSLDKAKANQSAIDKAAASSESNHSKSIFLYGNVTDISVKSTAADVVIPDSDDSEQPKELKDWWAACEPRAKKWKPFDPHRILMYNHKMSMREPLSEEMKIFRPLNGKTFRFVDDSCEDVTETEDYDGMVEAPLTMDSYHERINGDQDCDEKEGHMLADSPRQDNNRTEERKGMEISVSEVDSYQHDNKVEERYETELCICEDDLDQDDMIIEDDEEMESSMPTDDPYEASDKVEECNEMEISVHDDDHDQDDDKVQNRGEMESTMLADDPRGDSGKIDDCGEKETAVSAMEHYGDYSEDEAYEDVETTGSLGDSSGDDSGSEDSEADASIQFPKGEVQMTRCHETAVKVIKNGRIMVESSTFPLFFVSSPAVAMKLQGMKGTTTIHFMGNTIQLRVKDQMIYEKAVEKLLSTSQGEMWLLQLIHEMEFLYNSTTEQDQNGAPATKLAVIPYSGQNGGNAAGKNAESRRKLFQGAKFNVSGGENAQLHIRGVHMMIPREADMDTVFAKASLVPEGKVHENHCVAKDGQPGDPAYRLGILITYSLKSNAAESKSFWQKSTGNGSIRRLNSLVDFLEGHDYEWSMNKPRRFLDKVGGRKKISYTS